jgi:hypothetical protein
MKPFNRNISAFFTLVRAGLWEQEVQLSSYGEIDYFRIHSLAEEQSVVGLVTAGLECVQDEKVPKAIVLSFIGAALQLEQRNKSMNEFVARLIDKLRNEDVYALLIKGQGVAQCYERPLWRAAGDVDLLLGERDYEKAKHVLLPQATNVETEYKTLKHLGMTMNGGFVVELHGSLRSRLSKRVDRGIDEAQKDVFFGGNVRSWQNGTTQVFLPGVDDDVIFLFTHILHHFYIEGIGLRQICDWCRLLWTYRSKLNTKLLENRLRKMGLMSEWRAFAALAVDRLGIPIEAMPLYSPKKKWSRKANHIIEFVLETGNFGHNRQVSGGKIGSAWRKMKDFLRHSRIFPLDSVKFFCHFLVDGVKLATQNK